MKADNDTIPSLKIDAICQFCLKFKFHLNFAIICNSIIKINQSIKFLLF